MDDASRDEFAAEFSGFVDMLTGEDRLDLRELASQVAVDAVDVVAEGGEDMDEVLAQMRGLFEEHRIEVVAGGWEIIGAGLRLFLSGAKVFA